MKEQILYSKEISKQREISHLRKEPVIYFVIPCYNEEECLSITAGKLLLQFDLLLSKSEINNKSRVLFVDDGSHDRTWEIISKLHDTTPNVFRGIRFSHNEGHQNALYAGMMYSLEAGADATISLDADLQDDISVLGTFIERYCKGDEIVYGVRSKRAQDTWFKRNTAEIYYKVLSSMGAEIIPDHADYRLLGRDALRALSEYSEVNLFLRGIVPSLGFSHSRVYYERSERKAGESKYPLSKMISFAIQGITSFSTKPLKFVTVTGLLSIIVGLIMLVYVIYSFATGHTSPGWVSVMCSLWLIGGFIMLSLGIVGEYIGKIYLETKRRPRYHIDSEL